MKWLLLLVFLPALVFAGDPHHDHTPAPVSYNLYKTEINADYDSDQASSRAFAGLNFDRGTLGLQWGCSYGQYDDNGSMVCGLGKRIGNKNSLLFNGAASIGEDKPSFNFSIGGVF